MLEIVQGYYSYIFLVVLFLIATYGIMMKQNLMKKVMALNIMQVSAILFWIVAAYKEGATVPILDPELGLQNPDLYMNPLPQTLMLTAIVVAVATLGVAFSLLVAIYRRYGTIDEPTLLQRMREEPEE